MTVVTVAWFCFDNFIELNGFGEFLGRVRLDMALLVGCYCLTHMSLLMLAYRRGGDNILLAITCLAVALSGLGYFVTLSGFAEFEAFFFVLAAIVCLFFTKFALTIAVIVASINSSTLDSRAYIAPVKPVHKLE